MTIEYWTDTDIPKSTDNAFNCVPRGEDKPAKVRRKHRPKEEQKLKLEKRILRENKYQFRPLDNFCVHIATREESDRTLSIRR
jgi:hypothetical protein